MDNIHFRETLECVFLTPSTAPLFTPTCFPGLFSSKTSKPFCVHPTFCPAPKLPDYYSWPPTVPSSSYFLPRHVDTHLGPTLLSMALNVYKVSSFHVSYATRGSELVKSLAWWVSKLKKWKKKNVAQNTAARRIKPSWPELPAQQLGSSIHACMHSMCSLLFGGGWERGGRSCGVQWTREPTSRTHPGGESGALRWGQRRKTRSRDRPSRCRWRPWCSWGTDTTQDDKVS